MSGASSPQGSLVIRLKPTATSSSKYQYRCLKTPSTIRLLKILPDLVDGKHIACTLQHFNQDELPPYAALSYYWGDGTPRKRIYIGNAANTGEPETTLHEHDLHESLWEFLDQLYVMRQTQELIWTDFLCLDQHDDSEIHGQVPRMGEIYSEATRTISWLGRLNSSTPTHMRNLEDQIDWIPEWVVAKQESIDCLGLSSSTYHQTFRRRPTMIMYGRSPHFTKLVGKAYISMSNILSLPYWTRIWIVQEVALAKRVDLMFGSKTIDLEQLVLVYLASVLPLAIDLGQRVGLHSFVAAIEARSYISNRENSWWVMLEWGKRCDSSRDVDRIYGLLGLLNLEGTEKADLISPLEVDYNKNLSEVYWDVTFGCRLPPLDQTLDATKYSQTMGLPYHDIYSQYWKYFQSTVPYHSVELWSCSTFLTALRKSLQCASGLGTLETFANSSRTSPIRKTMALVAIRLASACRSMGYICESTYSFLGPGPRPSWLGTSGPSLWQLLLSIFLQFDRNDELSMSEKVRAAAVGVLVEKDERCANQYGPADWICHDDGNVGLWPGGAKYTLRFESLDGTTPECSLHRPETGKCHGSRLYLDLREVGCVLKFEVEALEAGQEARTAGVVSIAIVDAD